MKRSDGSELNIFWRLCNEDFMMDAVTFRELAQTVWASFCELTFRVRILINIKCMIYQGCMSYLQMLTLSRKYEKTTPVFTAMGPILIWSASKIQRGQKSQAF